MTNSIETTKIPKTKGTCQQTVEEKEKEKKKKIKKKILWRDFID